MATEIHLPDIGADDVEVTEIHVQVGDRIEEEQTLLTVEGDKASMEVPAPSGGVIKALKVSVGDTVSTGHLILVMEAADGAAAAPAAETPAAETPAAAPPAAAASAVVEVELPDIGGDEVEVTEIHVAIGDAVAEEQSLLTVEGDKASMEVPSQSAGVVKELKVAVGDKVNTGHLIMLFEVSGSAASAPARAAAPVAAAAPPVAASSPPAARSESADKAGGFVANEAYAHAAPAVRRMARELGVDLSQVKGTGRKGRVVRRDVQSYVKGIMSAQSSPGKTAGAGLGLLPWPKVDFSRFGEVELKARTRIQKISAANLHRNWVMIPHVTQFEDADITEMNAFRKEQNALAAKMKTGVKLSPLVFVMKAVAGTLRALPQFNSSLSEDGEQLILKKYVHIGIAVDTPNGLVVPVIRDVDQKGVFALTEELGEVSKKARKGKLTASDMSGGSFTISSLGGIGGTAFTPIVNAPEVAILGVSKASLKPVWDGQAFQPRLMCPLSLSYDHRVIDGAAAARFTTHLSGLLTDLRRLIL